MARRKLVAGNWKMNGNRAALAELVQDANALDVYVLPSTAGTRLIEARERAFWVAKAAGANEIIDIVVPRSTVPTFLSAANEMAQRHEAFISGWFSGGKSSARRWACW